MRSRLFVFVPLLVCLYTAVVLPQNPPNGTAITGQVPVSQHVFLIVLENTGYATATDPTNPTGYMPSLVALGSTYGHATNYVTNSSGSLLDYLWLSSGYCHSDPSSTADCVYAPFPSGVTGLHDFGCTGGACVNPATQDYWPITDDNIYREMIHHTPSPISWKLYAESIPYAGYTGDRVSDPSSPYYGYDPHHNPPLWYSDVGRSHAQAAQQLNMVPFTQFVTDLGNNALPQYSIIIPDDNHDAHDGTPAEADTWLQTNVFTPLLSQPFFQPGGDGLLIITFDNGDDDGAAPVYTAVIGPKIKPGYVSNTLFHHQDALLTILQSLGISAHPGFSAVAKGLGEFFPVTGPIAELSATSISFSNQTVGTTSTTRSFTLYNAGNAALPIASIGVSPGDFAQTNNCPASLDIAAFCTISLTFTPSVLGKETATVTIVDSLTPNQVVSISGTGATPALTVGRYGTGFGTITDTTGAVNCYPVCTVHFPFGTVVDLIATPLPGSVFAGWGVDCSGKAGCSVTMNTNADVHATFNAQIPPRPTTAVVDSTNALASNLVGLFLVNEGTGTTDVNLADGNIANFAGTQPPTWYSGDHTLGFQGGASLNSYLDAGTDLAFDQMPTSQITLVAKVLASTIAPAGIAEKEDGNHSSGFLFGWNPYGALRLTVEKSTGDMRVATGAGVIPAGKWVQVAFTWDGTVGSASAAHLFINGIEQAKAVSSDGSGKIGYKNATNQPFRIGNVSFDPMAGSLKGRIAYLAVYKGRILTSTELNQLDAQLPIK
ncbi:MAG TPA: alkaline phosphatase family protein [Candidatus Koribacter sp.]|jgi:hypothetical protein